MPDRIPDRIPGEVFEYFKENLKGNLRAKLVEVYGPTLADQDIEARGQLFVAMFLEGMRTWNDYVDESERVYPELVEKDDEEELEDGTFDILEENEALRQRVEELEGTLGEVELALNESLESAFEIRVGAVKSIKDAVEEKLEDGTPKRLQPGLRFLSEQLRATLKYAKENPEDLKKGIIPDDEELSAGYLEEKEAEE